MQKNKAEKVKIFVGYYKPNYIFKSDVFQPILTSDIDWNPGNVLIRDNTGDNIADKNKYYGELSGHYWVWKNFLPTTDADYIGFCHYRRFLDFNITPLFEIPFRPVDGEEFKELFKEYTEETILNCIEGYDIILPQIATFRGIVYAQYLNWHPKDDMDFALNIIRDNYPEYVDAAMKVMGSTKMYICLNFIMRKELLNEYMEWAFGLLSKLEKRTDWSKYVEYSDVRVPAFIMERFFNIWLTYMIESKNLKVLNTSSLLLVGEEYCNAEAESKLKKYDFDGKELKEIKE